MTIKQRILEQLSDIYPDSATYEQLAYWSNAHEPSIRRACMQLYRAREIHYTRYDPPVAVAFGWERPAVPITTVFSVGGIWNGR